MAPAERPELCEGHEGTSFKQKAYPYGWAFCIEAPRGASLPHAAHLPWCALPARPSQGLAFDAEIAPCLRYFRARLNHSAALVALQWAIFAHCPSGRRFATSKNAPGVFVCRPSLACIASRPACGSPTSFLTKLSPCYITLRVNGLCTKRQTRRIHHTQTPVRRTYRSHPAIVIKTFKRGSNADQ